TSARTLRALRAKQREVGQRAGQQPTVSREFTSGGFSPAGLSIKEPEMNRPTRSSASSSPWNGYAGTINTNSAWQSPGTGLGRAGGSRGPHRNWRSLATAATVLAVFLAWALRAGRVPDGPETGPVATPVIAKTEKIEADRVIRKKLDDGTIVVARAG